LIRTGSRSSLLGLVVMPFLLASCGKWLLGVERAKIVKKGRLSIHLQKTPQLSKEWGEGHTEGISTSDRVNYSSHITKINCFVVILLIIYLSLFFFNTLNRTRYFSTDSMNYVNVARNITAGKGISQPTLGFNQPTFSINDQVPTPFTSQPPLYPLMIALISLIGISHADAALVVSFLSYIGILLSVFLITVKLFNKNIASIALGFLILFHPLRFIGRAALSEALGIFFVLFSM
jgi:hypothetical protein